MAKKISQLTAASAAADSDEHEVNQAGTSKKVTRAQIIAGLAALVHSHAIADVTGLQAALDAKSADGHQHTLDDVTDAGALAAADTIGAGDIDASAYASQAEAQAGTENSKLMTALRVAQAIAALASGATLAGLSDVNAGAPNDNEVLTFDTATGKWTSEPAAAATVDNVDINMQDKVLTRAALKDFAEISPAPAISSGTLTLDLETGNVFAVSLTEDVTSLVLSNPPASGRAGSCTIIATQDATGGRAITWPAAVKWPTGAPPSVTAAANAIDTYALVTRDGGTTWLGFPAGQDFI